MSKTLHNALTVIQCACSHYTNSSNSSHCKTEKVVCLTIELTMYCLFFLFTADNIFVKNFKSQLFTKHQYGNNLIFGTQEHLGTPAN